MQAFDSIFGKIIVNDRIPEGQIWGIPPITVTRVEFSGETKEYWEWNPKKGFIISNVGK